MLITKSQDGEVLSLPKALQNARPAIATVIEKGVYGVVYVDSLGDRVFDNCSASKMRALNPYTNDVRLAQISFDSMIERRAW
jgi:hypothetical protein